MMGFSDSAIRRAARHLIETHGVPGAVAGLARNGGELHVVAVGSGAAGRPLRTDSLLPVASITKLVTALVILKLADIGSLSLDDPLSQHLPDAAAAVDGVTIRRLLSHTAGLPNDLAEDAAPYRIGLDWDVLRRACLQTPLMLRPGERMSYSNVGVGLLAIAAERIIGRSFPDVARQLVFEPLGMDAWLGQEPDRLPNRVAGTSRVGTDLEPYNTPFWRSLALPWGGADMTIAATLKLVQAFDPERTTYLRPETATLAISDQTNGLPCDVPGLYKLEQCAWGLGPEIRGANAASWMPGWCSDRTFGHAGASGAFVWCDPEIGVAGAFHGLHTMHNGWWRDGCQVMSEAFEEVLSGRL